MSAIWPLFDLEIRHPRFVMHPPQDDEIEALAKLAAKGIHGDDFMPFTTPWSLVPSPQLERNIMQFHWNLRAAWKPTDFQAAFVIVAEGQVIGIQALMGRDFGTKRQVKSGSWLGKEFQGQGFGKAMRAVLLDFAFGSLGAEVARSAAHTKNIASIRISEDLGYEPDTSPVQERDGKPEHPQFLLTREAWLARDRSDLSKIEVEGLQPCLEFFGLGTS